MEIITITCPVMPGMKVNAYLLKTAAGFVLIDSAMPRNRRHIDKALADAGCTDLKLILLTHGDLDHIGNAASLRREYRAPLAIHEADVGMVENGDMFASRQRPNIVVRALIALIFGYPKTSRFSPDIVLHDGDDLSQYGLDATLIHIPGHSGGNSAILTAEGDCFCGDLLANTKEPALWVVMDDVATAKASVEKLSGYPIQTIYPGHGAPFPATALEAIARR